MKTFEELVRDPNWKARWEKKNEMEAAHRKMMDCALGSNAYVEARREFLKLSAELQAMP